MISAPWTRLKIPPFILYLSLPGAAAGRIGFYLVVGFAQEYLVSVSLGSSILSHLHSLSRLRVRWAPKYYILYNLGSLCCTQCVHTVYSLCSKQCVHRVGDSSWEL